MAYYDERVQESQEAREYLAGRGLGGPETLTRFRIGFADISLGLRLPHASRKEGETLRRRLEGLGL